MREAHLEAVHNNPLSEVNFRAPLTVAGCRSLVVVRAEGLTLEGVPVAFELDARGRHRGTPIGAAVERLNRARAWALQPPKTHFKTVTTVFG